MLRRSKTILNFALDPRSFILAFALFNFVLVWSWDRQITFACVACPWYHSEGHFGEPTILLIAAIFLRLNRWWGNSIAFALAGYLVGYFAYILLTIYEPLSALRADWRLIRADYPYLVGSWDSQYFFALIILCCSAFYIARAILRRNSFRRTADNKSLDASGGSVFLNLIRAAMLD